MRASRYGSMWAVGVIALAGCYNHTYHVGAGASTTAPVVYDHWRHHWLGGLISPDQEIFLSEVCPSGNATIAQEVSFLNGLVGALTSGIYVPATVKIRCEGGGNADLDLDAETIAGFVTGPEFLGWVEATLPERLTEAATAQAQLDR